MSAADLWEPVRVGEQVVHGVHPQASGLLDIEIRLVGEVDGDWAGCFERSPGVSRPLSMHPPKLVGRSVRITPPDNQVDAYRVHVMSRIEAANRCYEQEVLPRRRVTETAEAEARTERERRISEAQRRLDEGA